MKIIIGYPPLESEKGVPLLSQNRQFQWFKEPTYIYPVVPAMAATLLKKAGYNVVWKDGIAEEKTYEDWLREIRKENPDLIVIETKTPVVKKHWKIISDIKKSSKIKVVLVGDHVTALPEESFKESGVDYILTGGDYDFLLLNLVENLTKKKKLEPGIFYRDGKKIKNTGKFALKHNLNDMPFIDRELTRWKLYAYKNGNFKRLPGAYIMSGRDCWWHKCKFCSWTTLYNNFRVRIVENVLDEIGMLIEKYYVREIMDDTGTFPCGKWLRDFCEGMIKRGYNKKIRLDCNMRFGILKQEDYQLMSKAGFRLLLFGLESGNQSTLDRLDKGIKVNDITEGVKMAKKSGLEPHITTMMGYPWESKQEAENTIKLAKELFDKGYVDTLQATIMIPYPGTPLFKEAKERGWLRTLDWNKYDMKEPVLKAELSEEEIKSLVRSLYTSFTSPRYILRKVSSIRNLDDLKFYLRAGKKLLGHLLDFK